MIAFFVIVLYTLKLLGEGVPPFIVIMSLLFERFLCCTKGCDGQCVSTKYRNEMQTLHLSYEDDCKWSIPLSKTHYIYITIDVRWKYISFVQGEVKQATTMGCNSITIHNIFTDDTLI